MATPLLQTKLYIPPTRPELVPRPRLIERLNAGLYRKLTLISAPAGFGKTTLVSEWVSHLGSGILSSGLATTGKSAVPKPQSAVDSRVGWLSLDEGDDDPVRFLTYLVAALQMAVLPPAHRDDVTRGQGVEAGVGKGVLSALQSPQPRPVEAVLTTLINDVAAVSDRVVLVLDDYHLIEAQSVHDALTFLLRRLPPQIHLVIITRVDPPLPLARLRARGQLTELRAIDLRFTPSETAEFLNEMMGLDLSVKDIAALERRTEGWIAGLQLAAISMQGREDVGGFVQVFTGSHHFVLDYLVEEVLERQPQSLQSFLLQTAVLDRLTGPLCDVLTGQDAGSTELTASGQATLETLERANVFIVPLDDERRWYRYHHLFADLLRQRLRQARPERVPALHQRASDWFKQNGFIDEAIEHALRAQDYERAATLIEENVDAIWQRGEHIKSQRWLDCLPLELVFSRPHLCILHAWDLFASGQQDAAEKSLRAAEAAAAERALGASTGPATARLSILGPSWTEDYIQQSLNRFRS